MAAIDWLRFGLELARDVGGIIVDAARDRLRKPPREDKRRELDALIDELRAERAKRKADDGKR